MAIDHLQSLMWNSAILSGGLSIVARGMARQSWKNFEVSLKVDLTSDTGDIPYTWEWDFRSWHKIGLGTAGFSILCSVVWLFCKLIYP